MIYLGRGALPGRIIIDAEQMWTPIYQPLEIVQVYLIIVIKLDELDFKMIGCFKTIRV